MPRYALGEGCGETGFPHPPTRWEGLGGRSPPRNNRMFIPSVCGASRMGVWGDPHGGRDARVASPRAGCPRSHETCEQLTSASFLCRSGPLGYNEAGLIRHGVEGCCRPMPQGRPLALPLRKNARLRCAARGVPVRWRLLASSADVNTVRSVQPPSQPPPAGGRSRTPAPSGGGSGRGPSPCPGSRDAGGMPAHPGHMYRAECAPRRGPDVNIVRRMLPPSQPPPAGGRSRTPSPSGGGSGRGPSPCPQRRDAGGMPALPGHVHRAECAPGIGPDVNIGCWSRGMGKPGFPIPRPREGWGGRSPPRNNHS